MDVFCTTFCYKLTECIMIYYKVMLDFNGLDQLDCASIH